MDPRKYEQNLNIIMANGFITNALCLGDDLGIFDVLKDFDTPVTADQIACKCRLKERYVREWLGSMVAANIIEMEGSNKYFIPPNCKYCLKNIYVAGGVPLIGKMLEKAKECFKENGPNGISYLDMESKLMDWIYDGLFQPDHMVSEILEEVAKLKGDVDSLLEVGCGEGILSRSFSRALPQANIFAVDYHPESISKAKAKQNNKGHLTFEVQNVTKLPRSWNNKFSLIVLRNIVHDLPNPVQAVTEIRRVLKDDGVAVVIDPGVHSSHKENKGDILCAAYFYAVSCFVCLPNSMNMDNAAGLGIGWGIEDKQKFLEESGFIVKKHRKLLNDDTEYAMFCMQKQKNIQNDFISV